MSRTGSRTRHSRLEVHPAAIIAPGCRVRHRTSGAARGRAAGEAQVEAVGARPHISGAVAHDRIDYGDSAMADTYDTQALPPSTPSASLISTTLLIYALYGIAAVLGLVSSGFPLIAPFF